MPRYGYDPVTRARPEGRGRGETRPGRTLCSRSHRTPAIKPLGGNGYINDYATGRIMRDAKLYEIGAGTSEIRRMLIGREFNKAYGVTGR